MPKQNHPEDQAAIEKLHDTYMDVLFGGANDRLMEFQDKAYEMGRARGRLDTFDFAAHLQRQREFSERTFGPGPRAAGVIDHIRKELREIEASPGDLAEWIDVVILALDGAWRSGATPAQIIDALVAKQARNEARTWPDWRSAPLDKAIEHDRVGDPIDDQTYFAHRNAGNKVFVKGGQFFRDQGGLTQEWGKNWTRIKADSLEQARKIAEEVLP
ncbi:dATP/dGTP pyrophosphohydrolase domain-containing protein [Pseudomonas sp. USHLN015]|uniref:dATP/dGTP pyrophosphohydrolase domain-containing protein n=1 Tax=Pseudomonas sp. USHLN015 TaxID=3081296 RepID=UPI00301D5A20